MAGKIFGQEETPETVMRQALLALSQVMPGTPISFWLELPVIEFLDWAQDIKAFSEKHGRQERI
jgi:hypothetical protein